MTDKLEFESRLLVDAACDGFGPDEIAVRRMRGRIAAAIAGGAAGLAAAHVASAAVTSAAATSAAATGTVASSAAGAATGAIGAKLVIAAIGLAIAAGTGAGAYAVITRHAAPAPAVPAIAFAPVTPALVTPALVTPAPVAPVPVTPAVRHELPTVSRADAIRSAPAHADAPHLATPVPPPASPPPSLARETQLLSEAQSELSAGRLADAIAAVARYNAETERRGQLAEEAAAIDVEARCKLRDPSAEEALDLFGVRWPSSHENARLVAECAR